MEQCDDGTLSEITILPDGRVYLFGMTLPLLEMLAALPTREDRWKALLSHCRASSVASPQKEPCRE